MTDGVEQIFLSDEILAYMRNAARLAGELREPFITVRTLLIALLEDPTLGPALEEVLPREADWRAVMTPEMPKEIILETV